MGSSVRSQAFKFNKNWPVTGNLRTLVETVLDIPKLSEVVDTLMLLVYSLGPNTFWRQSKRMW